MATPRSTLPSFLSLVCLAACGGPEHLAVPADDSSASPQPAAAAQPTGACWSDLSAGGTLRAVAGSGTGELWAVGAGNAVVHWDGSTWSADCTVSSSPLLAIWSAGPGETWAVGEGRVIVRWDGQRWSRQPDPSRGTAPFVQVWGAGGHVFVLARDEVLHFDGRTWSHTGLDGMVTLGFDFGQFRDLSVTGPNDAWIAAERGVIHWDGQNWSLSLTSPRADNGQSVWAAGPGEVWTVGQDLDRGGGFAWLDGPANWRPFVAAPLPALTSIRGAGPEAFATSDSTVLRWDGTGFIDLAAPAPPAGSPLVLSSHEMYVPDALGIARWNGASWARVLTLPGR